ncbi:methyltransferase domain-containing protein [Sulfurimonas sp. SAG-AH-194-I05]|nr:methyltransferase domain-containing protein [Sulfurimonas sp. SAG-AH-194-I05]MDF1876081.1 methyltransferase domain-containing protein [Sulfurimonas sp. SAG-AH-194-I05]
MNELVKNKHGYYSIKNIPTQIELEKHYSEKYYQDDSIQYSHKYSSDELKHFKYISDVAQHIYKNLYNGENHSFLDVGTGEGFFASNFFHNKWNVTTMDYSNYGISTHNVELIDTLLQGDIFKSLEDCVKADRKFDFINLSNILEHVIDPVELLETLKLLLSKASLLRISVPNDYSNFQQFLLDRGYTTNTWLCPPDHLHYFTFESLSNLLLSLGYEIVLSIGEFPIELYLSNDSSNYVKNKEVGKFAHKSRIEVDNFLFEQGIEKYINYYKASADIGLSRQVVIYAKLKEV